MSSRAKSPPLTVAPKPESSTSRPSAAGGGRRGRRAVQIADGGLHGAVRLEDLHAPQPEGADEDLLDHGGEVEGRARQPARRRSGRGWPAWGWSWLRRGAGALRRDRPAGHGRRALPALQRTADDVGAHRCLGEGCIDVLLRLDPEVDGNTSNVNATITALTRIQSWMRLRGSAASQPLTSASIGGPAAEPSGTIPAPRRPNPAAARSLGDMAAPTPRR